MEESIKLKWETVKIKVNDLVPADFNPRKWKEGGVEELDDSLQKFNLVEIPVMDFDGTIIAGHRRIERLIAAGRGEEQIDVRKPNRKLSLEERKEYMLRSNVHQGEWDADKLKSSFDGFDFQGLGLDVNEIPGFKTRPPVKDDDFDLILPPNPVSVQGDLYELKSIAAGLEHRVLCGDSTSGGDLQNLTAEAIMDLLSTDPPYNIDYEGEAGKIKNDNMSNEAFLKFLVSVFKNAIDVLKPGGCYYIFHAESEGINFRTAVLSVGFYLKQCLIWVKDSAVLSRQDYNWQHEPVLYGWKAGAAHYFVGDFTQKTIIDDQVDLSKLKRPALLELLRKLLPQYNSSTIREKRPTVNDLHPTMKPVKLCARLIRNSSQQFEKVLDLFLGSGSNLIACEQLHRHCYGMELDERFVDVAIDRWVRWMKGERLEFKILKNGEVMTEEQIMALQNNPG